jgi:hypothetical protein
MVHLAEDDPFGYVAQLKAYAHSEGDDKYGWLAIDKQNGHLVTLSMTTTLNILRLTTALLIVLITSKRW